MPTAYSPTYVEAAWYPWWEKQGFFKPEYGVSTVLCVTFTVPPSKRPMFVARPNSVGGIKVANSLAKNSLAKKGFLFKAIGLRNGNC